MRRSIPVIVATAGGLALLANFHTTSGVGALHLTPAGGATALPPTTTTSSSTTGDTAAPDTAPPDTAPLTTDGVTPTSSGTPTTLVKPTTTSTPTRIATTTTTTAVARTNQVLTGPVITTAYGPVQVRVTLQGSQIIDVQALQLPSERSRSVRISQEAGPILRTEVLQAQSANIDLVSGASYTSDGYARSLQAALDQAP
jgi:uncharacterized protein with FMN-binding domain